ncbi:glycosyltransferase, partial [Mammaliicoccus sciuri]
MKFEYDITVLVPVYNAESFLETTIESIINQKLDPNQTYEVLLINDGSTDNSEEICRKYSELYDNFSYYYHNNRGVSFT